MIVESEISKKERQVLFYVSYNSLTLYTLRSVYI